jgi:hypothetical protein
MIIFTCPLRVKVLASDKPPKLGLDPLFQAGLISRHLPRSVRQAGLVRTLQCTSSAERWTYRDRFRTTEETEP